MCNGESLRFTRFWRVGYVLHSHPLSFSLDYFSPPSPLAVVPRTAAGPHDPLASGKSGVMGSFPAIVQRAMVDPCDSPASGGLDMLQSGSFDSVLTIPTTFTSGHCTTCNGGSSRPACFRQVWGDEFISSHCTMCIGGPCDPPASGGLEIVVDAILLNS